MYFCISWQYFCISTVFLFFSTWPAGENIDRWTWVPHFCSRSTSALAAHFFCSRFFSLGGSASSLGESASSLGGSASSLGKGSSIQGEQERQQGTARIGGEAQKKDLKRKTTRTQPDVTSYQDYNLDTEVEMDNLFKSTGMESMSDGNNCELTNKKSTQLCSECGQDFEAFNYLWVHIQSVHQNRHKCKDCGKTFGKKFELKRHIKEKHLGVNWTRKA